MCRDSGYQQAGREEACGIFLYSNYIKFGIFFPRLLCSP